MNTTTMSTVIDVHGHDTPPKLFRARCAEWSARPALRYKSRGLWHSISWGEYYLRARAAADATV